ncbi:MAG TPA: hypothetical protein VIM81_19765 [Gammaproteobacteria bacterium]
MEDILNSLLRWPIVEDYFRTYSWAWPLNEVTHFVGLTLLVGIVGMFDLRIMGAFKSVPVNPLRRLLPWSVLGFVLVSFTGLLFATGVYANISVPTGTVIVNDGYLQIKLIFYFLAGLNLLLFYTTGMARAVENLGPGEDAPPLAKTIAGASLGCWLAVVYFGRLIPWGQFTSAG